MQEKEKVLAKLVRYCQKANQPYSMQVFEMQKTHKKIFKSKKHKTVLQWQHLLPVNAEKLIFPSSLCIEHILTIWLISVYRF